MNHGDPSHDRTAARFVLALPVSTGKDAAVGLLDLLREAIRGTGPAVHPYPADRPVNPAVGAGLPLGDDEDVGTDPTAAVVTTSGSTGEPKPALLPASAMLAAAAAAHDRLGGPGTWLLGVPAYTVAGIMVCVRSLVARTAPAVCDLSAGFTPAGFVEAAARTAASRGGRRYASLVPTQVARLLDAGGTAVEALARFDAVLVGGSALPARIGRAAADAGVRLVATYGSSETCGGCVYDGRPLDGVGITLRDDRRVVVAGAVVARGYRSMPGHPAFDVRNGERSFVSDDIGTWSGDRLTVLGRVDDMIVTGGYKVSAGVVEESLRRLPGVADAVVVGIPDAQWGQRVVAAVLAGADAPVDAETVAATLADWRARVGADVGRWAAPEIHLVEALPVTGPGKPDRRAVEHLLAELRTNP